MKKCILLLFFVLLFTACSSGDVQPASTDTGKVNPAAEKPSAVEVEKEKPSNVEPQQATIEECVLLDEMGVKITAKSLETDSLFGTDLKLLIENNSDKNLTVQARNASVNGYMTDTMMSADVASGKKANDELTFVSSDLALCGIETIADLSFSFHIFCSDDWENYLDSEPIVLKTSAADTYEYRYDDAGAVLYEDNGLKIVMKGISEEDSILGPGLMLYLYNFGEKALTVQARDVSVNGFMMDPIFSEDILPDKHAIASVTFMDSDLEENDITEITEIEISFHVFDMEEWDTIVDTDPITISF